MEASHLFAQSICVFWRAHNSWDIRDSSGMILMSRMVYLEDTTEICLPAGMCTFNIYDVDGKGFDITGYYKISIDGVVAKIGYKSGDVETTTLHVPTMLTPSINPSNTTYLRFFRQKYHPRIHQVARLRVPSISIIPSLSSSMPSMNCSISWITIEMITDLYPNETT